MTLPASKRPDIIWIEGDSAHAAPVPPDTIVGNVVEMAELGRDFRGGQIEMANDPDLMRTEVAALMRHYKPIIEPDRQFGAQPARPAHSPTHRSLTTKALELLVSRRVGHADPHST